MSKESEEMNTRLVSLIIASFLAYAFEFGAHSVHSRNISVPANERQATVQTAPLETTICEIIKNPPKFNNKLVRVRGHVAANFEYSTIGDDGCTTEIWFAYGPESGSLGLVATVPGGARPGEKDANGNYVPPIKVKLTRDSNSAKFERMMADASKADKRSDASGKDEIVIHRVAATFVGRIDSVSAEVHAIHLKRSPTDKADYLGFGQMGLFDAQLVVRSVESDVTKDFVRVPVASPKHK